MRNLADGLIGRTIFFHGTARLYRSLVFLHLLVFGFRATLCAAHGLVLESILVLLLKALLLLLR